MNNQVSEATTITQKQGKCSWQSLLALFTSLNDDFHSSLLKTEENNFKLSSNIISCHHFIHSDAYVEKVGLGAVILSIVDFDSSCCSTDVIPGSVIVDINGIIVVLETFESIEKKLLVLPRPFCLRLLHNSTLYDAVYWGKDIGLITCPAAVVWKLRCNDDPFLNSVGIFDKDIILSIEEEEEWFDVVSEAEANGDDYEEDFGNMNHNFECVPHIFDSNVHELDNPAHSITSVRLCGARYGIGDIPGTGTSTNSSLSTSKMDRRSSRTIPTSSSKVESVSPLSASDIQVNVSEDSMGAAVETGLRSLLCNTGAPDVCYSGSGGASMTGMVANNSAHFSSIYVDDEEFTSLIGNINSSGDKKTTHSHHQMISNGNGNGNTNNGYRYLSSPIASTTAFSASNILLEARWHTRGALLHTILGLIGDHICETVDSTTSSGANTDIDASTSSPVNSTFRSPHNGINVKSKEINFYENRCGSANKNRRSILGLSKEGWEQHKYSVLLQSPCMVVRDALPILIQGLRTPLALDTSSSWDLHSSGITPAQTPFKSPFRRNSNKSTYGDAGDDTKARPLSTPFTRQQSSMSRDADSNSHVDGYRQVLDFSEIDTDHVDVDINDDVDVDANEDYANDDDDDGIRSRRHYLRFLLEHCLPTPTELRERGNSWNSRAVYALYWHLCSSAEAEVEVEVDMNIYHEALSYVVKMLVYGLDSAEIDDIDSNTNIDSLEGCRSNFDHEQVLFSLLRHSHVRPVSSSDVVSGVGSPLVSIVGIPTLIYDSNVEVKEPEEEEKVESEESYPILRRNRSSVRFADEEDSHGINNDHVHNKVDDNVSVDSAKDENDGENGVEHALSGLWRDVSDLQSYLNAREEDEDEDKEKVLFDNSIGANTNTDTNVNIKNSLVPMMCVRRHAEMLSRQVVFFRTLQTAVGGLWKSLGKRASLATRMKHLPMCLQSVLDQAEQQWHGLKQAGLDAGTLWPFDCPVTCHTLIGLDVPKCRFLRSSKYPLLLTFKCSSKCTTGGTATGSKQSQQEQVRLLYKVDDDVRQDEFMLFLFRMMDQVALSPSSSASILSSLDNLSDDRNDNNNENNKNKYNNNNKNNKSTDKDSLWSLVHYNVMALGRHDGLIEWVDDGCALSDITSLFGADGSDPIQSYLRTAHPSPAFLSSSPATAIHITANVETWFGVVPEIYENLVRSCAASSVLAYVFRIGDRHLDNLLLRSNGSFIHCDFGYIFGNDPKPFPCDLRFPKELLNGMGGIYSPIFLRCVRLAEEVYLHLRQHADLIVSTLWTMNRANISDLCGNNNSRKNKYGIRSKASSSSALSPKRNSNIGSISSISSIGRLYSRRKSNSSPPLPQSNTFNTHNCGNTTKTSDMKSNTDNSSNTNTRVLNVIRQVHTRLHLELSDIDARDHMRRTIYESVNAMMPNVMEQFHNLSMALR